MIDNVLTILNAMFEKDETVAIGLLSSRGMIQRFATNKQKIAEFVAAIDEAGQYEGIYVNLQHHSGQRQSIKKEDVDRFKYLLIDIDRRIKTGLTVEQDRDRKAENEKRPKDSKLPRLPYVPASDEDLVQLQTVREELIAYLFSKLGVMPTIVAATGNGWHLLYAIEGILPGDKYILGNCLSHLAEKFDTDERSGISIDRSTADEPQLVRLYGTWNRKGIASAERPHRESYILKHEVQTPVTKEQLHALTLDEPEDEATSAPSKDGYPELDDEFDCYHLTDWVHEHLPEHLADLFEIENEYDRDGIRHLTLSGCVNAGHKHRGDNDKTQLLVGKTLGVKCFSDDCAELTIGTFLRKLWELCGEIYPYPIWKKKEGRGLDIAEENEFDLNAEASSLVAGPEAKPRPVAWSRYAKALDIVREGKEVWTDDQGKMRTRRKAKHVVEEEILQFVLSEVLRPNARLYFDAYGFVFVPNDNRIFNWSNDIDAYEFLANLHLRMTQPDARLVRENLNLYILTKGEAVRIEKYGGMHGDAVYLNNGRGGMFRITADSIVEVPNGTDGVLVSSPDVKPWSVLEGNEGRLAELAAKLKHQGGRICDTPLCKHFFGMFEEGQLTSEQYQQLILLRYLSLFMGDSLLLHPMMMSLGEQGSGKSTLWEKIMWLLEGPQYESGALPTKMRDFVSSVTNSAIQIFDNIDGVNFNRGEYQSYLDILCKCCTGGKLDIAQLYETNVNRSYSLRCHIFLTARVSPFPSHRSDAARRTLFFPIRKPEQDEYVTVEQMKAQLLADSEDMKLETLLRLQLVVKALVANRDKEYPPISEMHSFENWTMRIADFEGWANEMVTIWKGCKVQYQERVTEDSPLIDAVRRWLGSNPEKNVGRWVRTSEIYKELAEKYYRQVTDAWRSSAVFGKRLKENFSALRLLGIEKKVLDGTTMYRFNSTPAQVGQCSTAYEDSVSSWRLFADREDAKLRNLDSEE